MKSTILEFSWVSDIRKSGIVKYENQKKNENKGNQNMWQILSVKWWLSITYSYVYVWMGAHRCSRWHTLCPANAICATMNFWKIPKLVSLLVLVSVCISLQKPIDHTIYDWLLLEAEFTLNYNHNEKTNIGLRSMCSAT